MSKLVPLDPEKSYGSFLEEGGTLPKVEPEITLAASHLHVKTADGKTLLKDISCQFNPGQISAVLGPSGAGKTSLFRALSMRIPQEWVESGSVTANGIRLDIESFRLVGTVAPQDDVLYPSLTPRELLTFSARLRRTPTTIVDAVLSKLELMECADTASSLISGGQRRRTSLGIELVHVPSILLADEPTTGLDSRSALLVVSQLKDMARTTSCCVVSVIHQPSAKAFLGFDWVVALKKGQMMYSGTSDGVLSFCHQQDNIYENPAEVLLDYLASKEIDQEAVAQYATTESNDSKLFIDNNDGANTIKTIIKDDGLGNLSFSMALWWQKTGWLFLRAALNTFRSVGIFQVRASCVAAIFFGCIYYHSQNTQERGHNMLGAFFLCVVFMGMFTAVATAMIVPFESPTLRRDYFNGVITISQYLTARLAVSFIVQIVCVTIFCSIFYPMTHRGVNSSKFGAFLLSLILFSIIAQLMGVFIGSIASSPAKAVLAVVPFYVPLLITSGYFFQKNDLSKDAQYIVYPLWFMSFFRYAFSLLVASEFNDGTFRTCDTTKGAYCPFNSYVSDTSGPINKDVVLKDYLDIPIGTVYPGYYFILIGFICGFLFLIVMAISQITLKSDI
uniref:ABC transporter domain-containing protein n=1 Tax=Aureoumbra lagunensis TaxID=44058 RepID=A0A6S8CV72_9STRA|mmetsp:Transcript_12139/g.16422  ORF Transcript_12139/g.16422 Transcript_12139/m.16422 type:complete len:618 (+) Transcript_12139:55-1908(+)